GLRQCDVEAPRVHFKVPVHPGAGTRRGGLSLLSDFRARARAIVCTSTLLVVLVVAATAGVRAAERAWITSNGTMAYSDGAWIAVGGVKLVQGDLEVRSEQMRYQVETEAVDFIGDVRIRRGDDEIAAD